MDRVEELITQLEAQVEQNKEYQRMIETLVERQRIADMNAATASKAEFEAGGRAALVDMAKAAKGFAGTAGFLACLDDTERTAYSQTVEGFSARVGDLLAATNIDVYAKQPELSTLLVKQQERMDAALEAAINKVAGEVSLQDQQIATARALNAGQHGEIRSLLATMAPADKLAMVTKSPEARAAVLAFGPNAVVLGFTPEQLADLTQRDIDERLSAEQKVIRAKHSRLVAFRNDNWERLQGEMMNAVHRPASNVKIFKGE